MKQLKLSVAVLAMAAMIFTGCKKDEESRYDGQTTNFTLTTADMGGAKAHLGTDSYLYWDANDPVMINGGSYSVALENGEAQLIDIPAADNYYAVYPASCVNGNAGVSTNITFPATYTYNVDANGNQKIETPMVAKAVNADNQLTFKCLTTLWKVSVPGGYTVNSITVTADNQNLSGTANVNIETGDIANITGEKTVTLNFGTPVSTDNSGKDFIIPVPEIQAGTLVTILVNTTSNTLVWSKRANSLVANHTVLEGISTSIGFTMHYTATADISSYLSNIPGFVSTETDPMGGMIATFAKPFTSLPADAFKNCKALTSITIPNGVTTIEKTVFYKCSNLTSVTLPDGVTYIGSQAFKYSGLTSVEIPSSVTEIISNAFSNCPNLANVTCHKATPSNIAPSTFADINSNAEMYVPGDALTAYQNKFSTYFGGGIYPISAR